MVKKQWGLFYKFMFFLFLCDSGDFFARLFCIVVRDVQRVCRDDFLQCGPRCFAVLFRDAVSRCCFGSGYIVYASKSMMFIAHRLFIQGCMCTDMLGII